MEPILTFPRSKFAWLVSNHSINLLSTTAHRYFVSVAVFAKMNAATEGYFCNLDVYHLYAEAVRQRIQPENWAQWITEEIQKNSSKA